MSEQSKIIDTLRHVDAFLDELAGLLSSSEYQFEECGSREKLEELWGMMRDGNMASISAIVSNEIERLSESEAA